MTKTNINGFKDVPATAQSYVKELIPGVTGINLTEQEATKLKIFLRYDTNVSLFDSIDQVYRLIGANFTKPSRFLVIPFIKNGHEHLNIQKI